MPSKEHAHSPPVPRATYAAWLALAPLLLASSPASALEPCEPLSEADLADRIHASLDAIHRADVQGHKAIIVDLEARIPCLEFVPPPERWAELLVGIAIVEYATGGAWADSLATALAINPTVDILVGPSHAFRQWTPPPPPASTGFAVPPGVRIYLDGELISEIPETHGVHLAQRRTGDGWTSILLHDEPIPESWFEEPPLSTGSLFLRADLGFRGTFAVSSQQALPPGTFFPDETSTDPGLGLSTSGAAGYGIPAGLYWDLALPAANGPRFAAGQLGFFWRFGSAALFTGAGLSAVEAVQDGERTLSTVAFPSFGGWLERACPLRWDLRGSVGLSRAIVRGQASLGVLIPAKGPRLRASLELASVWTTWEQEGVARSLHSSATTVGLQLGVGIARGGFEEEEL